MTPKLSDMLLALLALLAFSYLAATILHLS
jgi:hypothetical protein